MNGSIAIVMYISALTIDRDLNPIWLTVLCLSPLPGCECGSRHVRKLSVDQQLGVRLWFFQDTLVPPIVFNWLITFRLQYRRVSDKK